MKVQVNFLGDIHKLFLFSLLCVVCSEVVSSVENDIFEDLFESDSFSEDGEDSIDDSLLSKQARDNGDLEVILNPGPILSPDIVIGHFVDSNVNIHDTILEELGGISTSTIEPPLNKTTTTTTSGPAVEHSYLWPQKIIVDKKVGFPVPEDDEDDEENMLEAQLHRYKYLTANESSVESSFREMSPRESRREHCFQKINATSGSFMMNFSQDCIIQISSPDKMSRLILHCANIKLGNCSTNRDSLTVNVKGDLRFGRNSYLYCGPNSQIRTTSLKRKLSIRIRRDLSLENETECRFVSRKQRFLDAGPTDSLCGRLGRSSKIVGGKRVSPGLFPWMAQLDITRTDGSQTTCTGSLLSSMFILTAAHCLKNSESISIFLGGTDRLEFTGSEVTVQAEKYILHRNWNPRTLVADMALVKLSEPVRFTEEVSPICLPGRKMRRENMNGRKGVAAGWGRLETSESAPRQLYRVKLPFLNDGLCFLAYRRFFRRNLMMCTESTEEAAICYGDSGGPLMYKRKELVYQLGISSFSSSKVCGESYDVFTKLGDDFAQWINTKIRVQLT